MIQIYVLPLNFSPIIARTCTHSWQWHSQPSPSPSPTWLELATPSTPLGHWISKPHRSTTSWRGLEGMWMGLAMRLRTVLVASTTRPPCWANWLARYRRKREWYADMPWRDTGSYQPQWSSNKMWKMWVFLFCQGNWMHPWRIPFIFSKWLCTSNTLLVLMNDMLIQKRGLHSWYHCSSIFAVERFHTVMCSRL